MLTKTICDEGIEEEPEKSVMGMIYEEDGDGKCDGCGDRGGAR